MFTPFSYFQVPRWKMFYFQDGGERFVSISETVVPHSQIHRTACGKCDFNREPNSELYLHDLCGIGCQPSPVSRSSIGLQAMFRIGIIVVKNIRKWKDYKPILNRKTKPLISYQKTIEFHPASRFRNKSPRINITRECSKRNSLSFCFEIVHELLCVTKSL